MSRGIVGVECDRTPIVSLRFVPLPLVLTGDEEEVLEGWARRRKTAQGLATRSRIILLAAKGWNNSTVAQHLHVTRLTLSLTDGTPVDFTSCHRCEHRTWEHAGGELTVQTVLDRARRA